MVYLDDGYSKPNKYKMRITVDKDLGSGAKENGFEVYKAKIKLMQVTRDAKLRIKFLSPILTSEIVKNFKNESIRINLMNDVQE